MQIVRWIVERELIAATHLGAIGKWWFASAARRLRKLSGEVTDVEGLK